MSLGTFIFLNHPSDRAIGWVLREAQRHVLHLMLNSGLVLDFLWVFSLIQTKTVAHLGWKSKGGWMQTLSHPSLVCFQLCLAACLINIACEELPRSSRRGLPACFLMTWIKGSGASSLRPRSSKLIMLGRGFTFLVLDKLQYNLLRNFPFSLLDDHIQRSHPVHIHSWVSCSWDTESHLLWWKVPVGTTWTVDYMFTA